MLISMQDQKVMKVLIQKNESIFLQKFQIYKFIKIIQKINNSINQAMQDPEIKAAYAKAGIQATPMCTDEVAKFVRAEMMKYGKIAKDANIEPQ